MRTFSIGTPFFSLFAACRSIAITCNLDMISLWKLYQWVKHCSSAVADTPRMAFDCPSLESSLFPIHLNTASGSGQSMFSDINIFLQGHRTVCDQKQLSET